MNRVLLVLILLPAIFIVSVITTSCAIVASILGYYPETGNNVPPFWQGR